MSSLMKSLVFSEPGKMAIADVERPEPKGDELLIRLGASGICGTDVHIYNGDYTATFPLVPGHEFAGEVVAVGPDVVRVTVHRLQHKLHEAGAGDPVETVRGVGFIIRAA